MSKESRLSYIFIVVVCLLWPGITAQDACRDTLSTQQCTALATAGRCLLARQEMLVTCPLTCEFCQIQDSSPGWVESMQKCCKGASFAYYVKWCTKSARSGAACEDVNPAFCAQYVVLGVCNQLRDSLLTVCPLSCGFCTSRGNWGAWSNWGRCTASCGVGSSVRTRRCSTGRNQDCAGQSSREARFCNTQDCPPPGGAFFRLSPWSSWTICTRTCGGGTRTRNRRCISRTTNLVISPCSARTFQEESCSTRTCPPVFVYNWNLWGFWSPCTQSCESGTRFRGRTCNIPPQSNCGTVGSQVQTCNVIGCPLIIAWNQWLPWSACTRLCNTGTRTRTRTCSTGRTADCGVFSVATESCNFLRCAVIAWVEWSLWGSCSVPCGTGVRTRTRTCTTGLTADCGLGDQDSQQCNFQECPPASWLSWNSWSSCSRTCGPGTETRQRLCSTGRQTDCPGLLRGTGIRNCNLQRCPTSSQPAWNAWQSWRTCSDPCGGGTRRRVRECSSGRNSDCGPASSQAEPCNIHECPEIGWNPWSPWERCTRSCGDGTRTRRRTCSTGDPTDCGLVREVSMSTRCNTRACPLSFRWNRWAQWSPCTAPCGGGTRERSRTCETGRNADCGELSFQRWRCNTDPCRSGTWNAWNPWSSCSKTCNTGTRSRTRACSSGQDSDCDGNRRQMVNCNTGRCTRSPWNSWTSWTSCSMSCGQGSRTRRRTCSSGRSADCGAVSSQRSDCNGGSCPNWNTWNGWSSCSTTCGPGTRTRSRTCNAASNDQCQGQPRQMGQCNVAECPPARWNQWGAWSTCSKSCESGSRSRTRTCSSGRRADCGAVFRRTIPCNTQVCPPPTVWNRWTAWSSCSMTCGEGSTTRVRSCSTGTDLDCGLSSRETLPCNTEECPPDTTWSDWTPWSRCDKTCGRGASTRTRTCSTENDIDCGIASKETLPCNTEECPPDPEWSNWTPWSPCTRTCGIGSSTRIRVCSSGRRRDCGITGTEILPCNTEFCSSVFVWSDWSSLSECSVTCGPGTSLRTRTCNSDNALDCGAISSESFSCDLGDCPPEARWSSWLAWSPCDKTCGSGRRFRTRVCSGESCPGPQAEVGSCSDVSCAEECSCANEGCQDDPGGNCDVFAPHCAAIPSYAVTRCRRTCGLCPDQPINDRCQCDDIYRTACPFGQTRRYNATSCCIYKNDQRCGLNSLRSRSLNAPSKPMIQGDIAGQERWPWMVHLQTPISVCGGSLISSRWIVSAAHCLANQIPSNVVVRVGGGRANLTAASRSFIAQSVILHPLFRINAAQNIVENDIALVQLPEDISIDSIYTHPICLSQGEVPPDGFQCFIASWETSSQNPETLLPTLIQAKVEIVSDFSCRQANAFLRDYMVCAGSVEEGVDTCRGESGGPLMCQMCRFCEWHLIGITSFGPDRCGSLTDPGVYTRLTSFEDWITENTGVNAGVERSSSCF